MSAGIINYRPIFAAIALLMSANSFWANPALAQTSFEISLPARPQGAPVEGRLLLMLSAINDPEVRFQVGWVDSPPVFGLDVHQRRPGAIVVVDETIAGYPLHSLKDIPPGNYYVQALLNVYTEFHRDDGHTIWAHMDQWEGQQFNRSPGNLYSRVRQVHLGGSNPNVIKLALTEVIPPVQIPADTEWVKHVKIQSRLLSKFWGRPIYLGAVVLLPRGYASHADVRYPVIYQQGHFSLDPPLNFRTDNVPETAEERSARQGFGLETGFEFFQAWNSDDFPRMIAVTFLHPTPYYDDSYAVNSANNGPYGDAIMTELIPYIEENFRSIRQPYARMLTGGSTGGWESLALQVFHPDAFGGTWTLFPDPVDFRRYTLVNIYEDENSFVFDAPPLPGRGRQEWAPAERSIERANDGQPTATVRQVSQLESVLGSNGRSGGVLENWEAVYGPVGDDGYPMPLWDKTTGKIDHRVANYMRNHGYDLRYYTEANWPKIGPSLSGKLHLYCGDMDNYYLNLSVYLLESFLRGSRDPYFGGSIEYGRPMKGHGWRPMTNAQLVKTMAEHVASSSRNDTSLAWLHN